MASNNINRSYKSYKKYYNKLNKQRTSKRSKKRALNPMYDFETFAKVYAGAIQYARNQKAAGRYATTNYTYEIARSQGELASKGEVEYYKGLAESIANLSSSKILYIRDLVDARQRLGKLEDRDIALNQDLLAQISTQNLNPDFAESMIRASDRSRFKDVRLTRNGNIEIAYPDDSKRGDAQAFNSRMIAGAEAKLSELYQYDIDTIESEYFDGKVTPSIINKVVTTVNKMSPEDVRDLVNHLYRSGIFYYEILEKRYDRKQHMMDWAGFAADLAAREVAKG